MAADLWQQLGGAREIELPVFTGPDVVMPSVYPVTAFASACVAVATAAAADLAGAPPPTIDQVAASAAFSSERHLRIDGDPAALWDPVSGYYETADDRWIQLHCNFAHHRAGVIDLLGSADDRESVARAIRSAWQAHDLEEALASRGMCGTMLRSRAEWLAHPQGRAVAGLPLIEISRHGEVVAPERPTGRRPLQGLRVLDLTRIIAGPTCGKVLAQHGAEVLRVGAEHLPTVESCVLDTGFGKRSTHLDLRRPGDADVMRELVRGADAFVEGYRPGGLDSLGFGPDELSAINPSLIHVTLSAYSHEGPWRLRRGFDSLTQTASGIGRAGAEAIGATGTQPLPCQALDHGSGWLMAAAVMLAVGRRRREGGGWRIRTSLAQTGHYLAEQGLVEQLDVDGLTDDLMAPHLQQTASAWGELTHVGAVGRIDGLDGFDGPPVAVGSSEAGWMSAS